MTQSSRPLGSAEAFAAALAGLAGTIDARAAASADTSYTAKLLSAGPSKVAKKIGEEGVELSLAIAGEPETSVIGESVDVIYHLLVGLRSRGVSLDDIAAEISSRHGLSGLEEKAQRET